MEIQACPTVEELSRYVEALLEIKGADVISDKVAKHLEKCRKCSDKVEAMELDMVISMFEKEF